MDYLNMSALLTGNEKPRSLLQQCRGFREGGYSEVKVARRPLQR